MRGTEHDPSLHAAHAHDEEVVEPTLRWRAPREKTTLDKEHRSERVRVGAEWESLPANFFTHKVDLIIDNRKLAIPCSNSVRAHFKMTKVRGHLKATADVTCLAKSVLNARGGRIAED